MLYTAMTLGRSRACPRSSKRRGAPQRIDPGASLAASGPRRGKTAPQARAPAARLRLAGALGGRGECPGRATVRPRMARESNPDPTAIFSRSAHALAETFRALAREQGDADHDAVHDLTAAADAIDRALRHIA